MNHAQIGFLDELEKQALLANIGHGAVRLGQKVIKPLTKRFQFARNLNKSMQGLRRNLRKSKSFEGLKARKDWKKMKDDPFSKSKKFKDLKGWQKARIIGGIGMNTSLGVVPAATGTYALGKRIAGKDDYKKKYEDLKAKQDAQNKALRMYYGNSVY